MKANSLFGARDIKWLKENINIETYTAEANEILRQRFATLEKQYSDRPDLLEQMLEEGGNEMGY